MRLRLYLIPVLVALMVIGCKEQTLTFDSDARLAFSADTVCFDTVFTAAGSSTQRVVIYNPNDHAVRINSVRWQTGRCFFANLDGENNVNRMRDIDLYGGDSLYLFLRVEIDPYNVKAHPIETDTLWFETNGNRQGIAVQAYGMDVERIRSKEGSTVYHHGLHLTADKPYLIYDTLWVDGALTIDAGATLYMHNTANIVAYGKVDFKGTAEQPVRIMGDRTDWLFPEVPYRTASGQWGGIYLYRLDTLSAQTYQYNIEYTDILSGSVGLFCYSDNKERNSTLHLSNSRIHNMAAYGVVLENTNAAICNTEISNCAAYGLYMAGGTHTVEHTSVANYFGYPYTTLNIHNVNREKVAAVYVLAHSEEETGDSHSTLRNCIVTGAVQPAMQVDSIPESGYTGEIAGCYLYCDSLPSEWAHDNVYAKEKDEVFVNTYYKYKEYIYYDFRLKEQSPARHIGLPLEELTLKEKVMQDRNGNNRDTQQPDAGCYEYQ